MNLVFCLYKNSYIRSFYHIIYKAYDKGMMNMTTKLWTSRGQNGLFFNNRFFISPFFMFLTAVLCSCVTVCICFNNKENVLDDLILSFVYNRQTNSYFANFITCFITELIYLFSFYVFGTSAVGVPLIYIIIYTYLFGKSSVLSFLYIEYGLSCFFKSLIIVIPVYVFLCYVMMCAFIKAKEMSRCLFKREFLHKQSLYELNIKKYTASFLIYFAIVFVLSIFDAAMSRFTNFLIS